MKKPVVAIVGRPNVGKSTLFNKITGKRISIVEDTPGVTRDRIYFETEWSGQPLILVDTGGIEPKNDDMMLKYMRLQAQTAIDTADVIIFLTDIHAGLTADDRDIANMLLRSKKPIILAVNKVDRIGNLPPDFYEFYELGFKDDPIPVSSLHGTGTGDILDLAVDYIRKNCTDDGEYEDNNTVKVAVIGKPNAGKSSIINRILGEDRLIVSNIPGTTRDAIDTELENEYGKYTFIDTAGMRRQSKIEDRIEKFSVLRAKMAVERADVCLIMIDASEGVTEQDEKIAGLAHEAGKASIFVINKWDLIEKDNKTVQKFTNDVYTAFSYMSYAPLIFVSALTGQRINKLFELINKVNENAQLRITTGTLNDILNDATARVQPPSDKGKHLKIYYMTQAAIKPTEFVIFCNNAELFHFSYQRYLENQLRSIYDFSGVPIKLTIRQRGEGAEPQA